MGLHTSNAGSTDLIPGWETKLPHATQCGQNLNKKCMRTYTEVNVAGTKGTREGVRREVREAMEADRGDLRTLLLL